MIKTKTRLMYPLGIATFMSGQEGNGRTMGAALRHVGFEMLIETLHTRLTDLTTLNFKFCVTEDTTNTIGRQATHGRKYTQYPK